MRNHTYWVQVDSADIALQTDNISEAIQMTAIQLYLGWKEEGACHSEEVGVYESVKQQAFFMWSECISNMGGDETRDGVTVRITIPKAVSPRM